VVALISRIRPLLLAVTAVGITALAGPAAEAAAQPRGCAQTGVLGGEWRSYGHDLSNSRFQSNETVISTTDVPTLSPAFTFSTKAVGAEGDFTGTPVVADGCMYVASTRGWVFSVNADTGQLVWKAKVPYGGGVNSSVGLGPRSLPRKSARVRKCSGKGKKRHCKYVTKRGAPRKAGTVYVEVSRTSKFSSCPKGDPCTGPYVVAFDQATGKRVFATKPVDSQVGADVYGSPVVFDGIVMFGVSGGSAELGDPSDRYAFQGSMNFLDANNGRVLKKTWTIHPPKHPDNAFAGGGIWSTPAVDAADKVAFSGAGNPFKQEGEHPHTNAILKFNVNRRSKRFGQIIGSYKGSVDTYFPQEGKLPCIPVHGNPPPYYPQGVGSCAQVDMDFGASPNLFRDSHGRLLVGEGQKSGIYHVVDARTMKPVWTQIVGPFSSVGGIVGSTATDGQNVYGPITVPGYVWSISAKSGGYRWVGPIADGAHWGPPVTVANGVVYSVDFGGNLDAFDARTGAILTKRPLALGGGGPESMSWGGVSVARNTVYAAVGVLGLANGFVVAFRPGSVPDVVNDVGRTVSGLNNQGGGGGGGGSGGSAGATILSGPGAASTGYATPAMVDQQGGKVTYLNLDNVQHDVNSTLKGKDGRPLFQSKLIGLGESAPVVGADKVPAGTYEFYCSVHPGMRGQLVVQ
jgi:outer membrane protein assembly factor BamB